MTLLSRDVCAYCYRRRAFMRIATKVEKVRISKAVTVTRVLESEPRCLSHLQGGDGARYSRAQKNQAAAERRRKAEG